MYTYISIVMIAATLIFAVASPFIFRTRTNAVRTRITCALVHLATFEIIAVVMLEMFRTDYASNEYVSRAVDTNMFGYMHMVTSSLCVIAGILCVMLSMRLKILGRLITVGGVTVGSAALATVSYFILRYIEQTTEIVEEIDIGSGAPLIIGDALTDEYTSAVLPILVGAVLVMLSAAVNILLDSDKKWTTAIMAIVNIIDTAVYVFVFITLLGWVKELSGGSAEAVYSAAIFGIIVVLPPIISMCSVFADKITPANQSAKKKK